MNEIATLLQEVKTYGQHTDRWIALPLHSALSIEQQDKVFNVHFYCLFVYWLSVHFLF